MQAHHSAHVGSPDLPPPPQPQRQMPSSPQPAPQLPDRTNKPKLKPRTSTEGLPTYTAQPAASTLLSPQPPKITTTSTTTPSGDLPPQWSGEGRRLPVPPRRDLSLPSGGASTSAPNLPPRPGRPRALSHDGPTATSNPQLLPPAIKPIQLQPATPSPSGAMAALLSPRALPNPPDAGRSRTGSYAVSPAQRPLPVPHSNGSLMVPSAGVRRNSLNAPGQGTAISVVAQQQAQQRAPPPKPPPRPRPALPEAAKPTTEITAKLAEVPVDSHEQNREYAAKEILTTEEAYVEQLTILIENYKKPIITSKMLKDDEVKAIFLNLESLLGVHQLLLADLRNRLAAHQNMFGDIMCSLIPMFKLYIAYVNQYGESIKVLTQVLEEHPKFEGLIGILGTGKFTGKMGFESLRVVPIQRIPRYVLLLKTLLKYVPEEDPDFGPLTEAFNKISELATLINEKKREQESTMRLIEIVQNLSNQKDVMAEGNSTTPHKWKHVEHKPKRCDYCDEMMGGTYSFCKDCEYRVHETCQKKILFNCGEYCKHKTVLMRHNRRLVEEWSDVLSHKETSLKKLNSSAKVREKTLILLFNDSLGVFYPDSHRYHFVALIPWLSELNHDRRTTLVENVTEKAFSLTHPDKNMLHTFSAATKEKKDELVASIKKQIDTWGAHIKKIQTEKDEEKKTFEGVSFKISMTVPVASSHEKAFTAYVVDMTTQHGSITLIKRYSQFLSLHEKLKSIYTDVPHFPAKKLIGNMKASFIQKRMMKIETYLNEAIKLPGILDVPEVHTFLTTTISAKGEDEEILLKRQRIEEEIIEGSCIVPPQQNNNGTTSTTSTTSTTTVNDSTPTDNNNNNNQRHSGYAEGEEQEGGGEGPEGSSIRRARRMTYRDILPKDNPDSIPAMMEAAATGGGATTSTTSTTTTSTTDLPLGENKRSSIFGLMSRRNQQKAKESKEKEKEGEQQQPQQPQQPQQQPEVKRQRAVALWDFLSMNDSELDMLCNDVVTIYEKSSDEWWFGTVNGREFGFFPPTYVQVIVDNVDNPS